jgi:predicted nuclease of predicted toxin-antitoxin system
MEGTGDRGLKFLVDVGVSKRVEKWLLDHGYDTKNVRDVDPRMSDREILKIAVSERRMVITMDKDFGELVYNSGLLHGGVLLLRLEEAKADEKILVLEKILEKYADNLLNKFCVFKDGKLRIRK